MSLLNSPSAVPNVLTIHTYDDTDTDSDGRYTLTGLAAGSYIIRAEGNNQGHLRTYYDGRLGNDNADLVTVVGSEAIEGVNFNLELGVTLTGTVTDIDTGLPIEGLNMRVRPSNGRSLSWAETENDGSYVLRGVPGGLLVEVEIEGQGYVEMREEILMGDPGTVQSVDFALSGGTTITGRVFDQATGLPLRSVDVNANNVDEYGPRAYARSAADGIYVLRGVAPGTYRIEVGWNDQGYIREYYNDASEWEFAAFVTVHQDTPISGIDFGLSQGATISGRVTDEDTGLPIAEVNVRADNRHGGPHVSEVQTDSDGRYTLRGVAAGAYEIRAGRSGSYVQEFFEGTHDPDGAEEIVVLGGEAVQDIDFALSLGATISGQVYDAESGAPIFGAGIRSGPVDGRHLAWAETDEDGSYTLTGLPSGLIEVKVSSETHIEQRGVVSVGVGGSVAGQDFGLELGATIAGRVVDAATGIPIPGVKIDADSTGSNRYHSFARTNSDGVYALTGVQPGTYVIRAGRDHPTYVQQHYDDSFEGNQAEHVTVGQEESIKGINFALRLGGTISGRVSDAETGLPIAYMEVSARTAVGSDFEWTRTDNNGDYTLRGMPAGIITVWVSGQGYIEVSDSVSIAEGEHITGFDF